jgi:hypothetical protein
MNNNITPLQHSRLALVVSARKKGRLRCRKRPKSREETPKEGSDSGSEGTGGSRYRMPIFKTIAISGPIARR